MEQLKINSIKTRIETMFPSLIFVMFCFIENKFYQNKDWDFYIRIDIDSCFIIENKFYQNKDWDTIVLTISII